MGCQKEPIGVGYSLQCVTAKICEYRSGEMWGNFTAGIVCHSPRLSVWSLPPQRLFHLTHTHTHALLPQCYQRGPGAGVCPCQKVTGAPIGNPKIKDPLFPLYVLIWSLCLAFWKLLIFGVHSLNSGIQFSLAAFCFACIIFIIIIVRFLRQLFPNGSNSFPNTSG